MNYKDIYDQLIARAKLRNIKDCSDLHHIIPRCMGGKDDSVNLVYLTYEEHFFAHKLLVKIYPEHRNLIFAVAFMSCGKDGTRYNNNKMYGYIRKRIADVRRNTAMSEETKQKISNTLTGKPRTEETKHNISVAKKGVPGVARSPETRKKMSENHKGMTGKVHSEETKEKIRQKRKTQEPTFSGKIHSTESKEKMSISLQGHNSYVRTEQHKEDARIRQKGRVFTEEHKKKLKEAQILRRSRKTHESLLPA